jgi:anti-sigma factor RsiW
MNCEDSRAFLDGYADGELDLVNHLQIEKHLDECPACRRAFENRAALKSALADDSMYFRASSDLREKIRASLSETSSEPEPRAARWWQWGWTPALVSSAALAAILVTALVLLPPSASNDDQLAKDVVSSHIRSMMASHLTDVPSSDRHTVKPWFDGKLDFSPPVVDLAPQGFSLIGGRLDYVSGRPVAALVYQRRQHVINLFIFPTEDNGNTGNKLLVKQGYNLIHWNRSGMTFWVVSDLSLNELQEFAQDVQS